LAAEWGRLYPEIVSKLVLIDCSLPGQLLRALREDAAFVATLRDRKLPMPVMTVTGRHGVGDKLADTLRFEADNLASIVAENRWSFCPRRGSGVLLRKTGELSFNLIGETDWIRSDRLPLWSRAAIATPLA
jgi:hypothetical protein